MAQLNYSSQYPVGQEGMLADAGGSVIISKQNASTDVKTVTFTAANSAIYTLVVNGTAYTTTSDADATAAEIRDALKVLIDAGPETVTVATLSTTGLTITAAAGTALTLTNVGSDTVGNVVIATTQSTGQAIPFGRAVCWDSEGDHNTCRLPRVAGDVNSGVIWGVTMADTGFFQGTVVGQYPNHSSIPIIHKGRVWVVCDTAITTVGTQAFVRYAAGSAGSVIGGFTTTADTSTAGSLTGARFVTLGGAGELVQLELNLAI